MCRVYAAAKTARASPSTPIREFYANGNFIKAFGAGLLLFPRTAMFIDAHDHIWVPTVTPVPARALSSSDSTTPAKHCALWQGRVLPKARKLF